MPFTPNPTIITTQAGNYLLNATQRIPEVSDRIFRYLPEKTPFTALLKALKQKKAVQNTTYSVLEEQPQPWTDTLNGAVTAAGTAIVVDHPTRFKPQDLVKNERTGEICYLSAVVDATSTLTAVRGFGTTAAAAMLDNDPLRILGTSSEDGSGSVRVRIVRVDARTNYTERFKTTILATDQTINSGQFGEPEQQRMRKTAGIAHMIQIENAMIFGEAALHTPVTTIVSANAGVDEQRTTGGILSFLTSNVKVLGDGTFAGGAGLTENDFNYWLEGVMNYPGPSGSNKRTVFGSPRFCSVVDGWGRDKLQTVPESETIGIAVKEYKSSHGTVNIIKHPLLDGNYYGGYAIVVDLSVVSYAYLQNQDTNLYLNTSTRHAVSGQEDQYETEAGLYLALEGLHGVIKGVNS